MTDAIKSKAGHVLSTSEDPEARSLAASVLSEASREDEPEHTQGVKLANAMATPERLAHMKSVKLDDYAGPQTASGRMMEQRHQATERSLADMRALLKKIDGVEGMRERAGVLRGMIREAGG
jgi:hypothetical protein